MRMRKLAPGFSLIELQVVIVLIGILAAITVFALQGAIPSMKADSAMTQVVSFLRQGREMAVSQRRRIQVQFTGPTQLDLVRQTGIPPFPVVGTSLFESQESFMVSPGVPDTPDGFVCGPNVVCPMGAINVGGAAVVRFNADGTFTDDATSVPVNGTIFIGVPGDTLRTRAVTITGVTGRAQAYRWNGRLWEER